MTLRVRLRVKNSKTPDHQLICLKKKQSDPVFIAGSQLTALSLLPKSYSDLSRYSISGCLYTRLLSKT